jgi:hypothetical protein
MVAACDTRAQPAAAQGGGAGPVMDPERVSKELESCSRTDDCTPGLRCFDTVCRRTDRDVQADYLAARAANRRSTGDLTHALADFAEAVSMYDGKSPVDIDCAYGDALVEARADKEKAELGARVLHRCVNAAPAGSPLREAALQKIALLDELGFDPVHLDKTDPADVYLSKAAPVVAKGPSGVDIKADPAPTGKTWTATADALAAAKPTMLACAKKPPVSVNVPLETQRHQEYDDEPPYFTVRIDPKAPAPGSDAEGCIRDAVTAAVKGVKGGGSDWTVTVVVTVQ